jgi:hypothetical protein
MVNTKTGEMGGSRCVSEWDCGTYLTEDSELHQSDRCHIAELEQQLAEAQESLRQCRDDTINAIELHCDAEAKLERELAEARQATAKAVEEERKTHRTLHLDAANDLRKLLTRNRDGVLSIEDWQEDALRRLIDRLSQAADVGGNVKAIAARRKGTSQVGEKPNESN